MKPISLQIQNFTSFRQPVTVDFSNLELFAISGPTGAGKTSLLDAMLYALYGRTPRAGEKSIADLVSQGSSFLQVLLEFSAGSKHYRIARTIKKREKNVTSARRLEMADDVGEWIALADGLTEVRDKVNEIIGLDFDGFTKSVVLPQGEFDRFLKGDAKERRQILTDLLQLNIYLRMGQRARERAAGAETEISTQVKLLATSYADATPERREALKKDLKAAQKEHDRLSQRLEVLREAEPLAQDLRRRRKDIEKLEGEIGASEEKLHKKEERRRETERKVEQVARQLNDQKKRISSIPYDEKLFMELTRLEPVGRQLGESRRSLKNQEKLKEGCVTGLTNLQPKLEAARKKQTTAARDLLAAKKALQKVEENFRRLREAHGTHETIGDFIDQYAERHDCEVAKAQLNQELGKLREQVTTIKQNLRELNGALSQAEKEVIEANRDLESVRNRLSAADLRRKLQKGAPCPVCEQIVTVLPKPGKHDAIDVAQKLAEKKQAACQHLRQQISARESELENLPRQIASEEKRLKEIVRLIDRIDTQTKRILGRGPGRNALSELKALQTTLERAEGELASAQEQCEEDRKISENADKTAQETQHEQELLQQRLETLEQSIRELKKMVTTSESNLRDWADLTVLVRSLEQQKKHKAEKEKLEATLRALGEEYRSGETQLIQLQAEVHAAKEQIAGLQERESEFRKNLDKEEVRFGKKVKDVLKLEMIETDELDLLQQSKLEGETELREFARRVVQMEEQLRSLAGRMNEAEEIRGRIEELKVRAAVATELGLVLRTDHFLSFVLQEAFKRLASDGTRHLRTLSSERYSFAVEGDDFYVVDHWNADEQRSVHTLSGGESFLASLALALSLAESLSDLSTDREKFTLDSLFLDEGFSTLDPETLDVVVQGIEALATGNRLIGVISHVAELADRLPSRIQVRKSPGGSTLVVE